MNMIDNRHFRIFDDIPGAWAGNPPKPEQRQTWGNVIVNPLFACAAIDYLRLHGYKITETDIKLNGIFIFYSMKG